MVLPTIPFGVQNPGQIELPFCLHVTPATQRIIFKDYEEIGDRMFPRTMIFKDLLKENTQTTYKFDVIEFDVKIPARYFSQSILKR